MVNPGRNYVANPYSNPHHEHDEEIDEIGDTLLTIESAENQDTESKEWILLQF